MLAEDPVIEQGTMMESVDDGTSNFLRYRALRLNYYAVSGLLARVALYAGMRETAFNNAVEVIRASNKGIFPFVDRNLVTGSPEDPDRIFASEVLFALSHDSRNQLFKNYFDPARSTYVFKMETDLLNNRIYGGLSMYGGSQDDYRCRVNWMAVGSNRYFYKYSDMVNTGSIKNTMIPMLKLGEMYLIAAESQSANLAAGTSYVNTLRSNRGVRNISSLTYDLLKYEYIRELYGEGQLFFMYKRLYAPIIWSDTDSQNPMPSDDIFVLPLPDSESENR